MQSEDIDAACSHHLPGALLRVGRSSKEGLSMGRHEKVPVHCPYSRSAALHGAPRTWVL